MTPSTFTPVSFSFQAYRARIPTHNHRIVPHYPSDISLNLSQDSNLEEVTHALLDTLGEDIRFLAHSDFIPIYTPSDILTHWESLVPLCHLDGTKTILPTVSGDTSHRMEYIATINQDIRAQTAAFEFPDPGIPFEFSGLLLTYDMVGFLAPGLAKWRAHAGFSFSSGLYNLEKRIPPQEELIRKLNFLEDGWQVFAGWQTEENKALKHGLCTVKGRRSRRNWIGGTSF